MQSQIKHDFYILFCPLWAAVVVIVVTIIHKFNTYISSLWLNNYTSMYFK